MPDRPAPDASGDAPYVFAGPLLTVGVGEGTTTCVLPVPASVADALDAAGVRRLLGTMEGPGGSVDFDLAVLTLRGQRVLMVSQARCKAMGATDGDTIGVEMRPDPTPDVVAVPPELAAALAENAAAAERFCAMTPGKQRGLVHYVNDAKRAETRHGRAHELAHKLATYTLYGDTHRPG